MTKNNWVCSICLESDDKDCYTLKPCNHKFHSKCLIESLRKCGPNCRDLGFKITEDGIQASLRDELTDWRSYYKALRGS